MAFFKRNKFIILLLLSVFVLRLPSLLEPYWYGDENIYLTLGMGINKGLLLYRDIFDNKPPMIYLLAALAGGKLYWFKFELLVLSLGATFLFYRLAKIFFDKNDKAIIFSSVLFSLLTTLPVLEGNIVNAEILILSFCLLGLYLIFKKKGYFFAGLIFSLGFLFKVPALFDFATILVYSILFFNPKKLIDIKKQDWLLTAGFVLPVILIGIFFWLKDSWGIFFNSVFVQTMGYLSSWETGSHAFSPLSLLKSELAVKGLFVALIFLFLWIQRKKLNQNLIFVSLWFVLSFFGATLSGRPYAHYLIQVLPSLCLLFGYFFLKNKKGNILFPAFALIIFILSFVHYRFWIYPVFSYYKNFISFFIGTKDKKAYYSFFNPSLPKIYETAEFIAANSKTTDKIFVWADEPSLYPLSERLPATSFVVAYHILDLKKIPATAESLNNNPPAVIITGKGTREFPFLEKMLINNYLKLETIGNFVVYRQRILK